MPVINDLRIAVDGGPDRVPSYPSRSRAPARSQMGSLGNIYESRTAEGGRLDLHAEVEVPRRCLGNPRGIQVALPRRLPCANAEGGVAERVRQPGEPEDAIVLHLAEGFADGSTLRIRGAGGARATVAGGGDLYVKVRLTEDPGIVPPSLVLRVSVALGVAALAAALCGVLG